MDINLKSNSIFVFDLDDTLYAEIDFLKSAYRHIDGLIYPYLKKNIYAEMWWHYQKKENVFQWIIDQYKTIIPELTMDTLLSEYRGHLPEIKLADGAFDLLQELKARDVPLGIITDGRSNTQRNKLKALNILHYFDDIIISEEFGSEKPSESNYKFFTDKYPNSEVYFLGDNTSKDFIVPQKLKWITICVLDKGENIHKQDAKILPELDYYISSFAEIQLK
jgi:putative hydrolase of the HAD superfamily